MAEFHFLKGTFKGRLGDVVWSSWRGTQYAKVYTPPSNPRTEKQRDHRETWGTLGHIAKDIYEPILKPYTLPKPPKMTAYNALLKLNSPMLRNNAFSASSFKVFDGPLAVGAFTGLTYDTANKKIQVTWGTTLTGDARNTDKAIAVAVQSLAGSYSAVGYGITTRETGTLDIRVSDFPKIKNGQVYVYLVFAQEPEEDTEEKGQTSATACKTVTVSGITALDAEPEQPAPANASN